MTDPTADTSAIEAALDNLAEEYDRLRTLHDAALADNARLTAALGEAEGERDRVRAALQDVIKVGGALDLAEADAATGRAVGRRLRQLVQTMATELDKWGHGDMHYGPTARDPDVTWVLAEYRRVMAELDGGT